MTRGAHDKNAVVISTIVGGLLCDTKKLGERIRSMIASYHSAEGIRSGFNGANDEIEALESMTTVLKLAQRKMQAAPLSLKLWVERAPPGKWDSTVSEFERIVSPILVALEQTQNHMTEHRQGRGNPASMENRDLLLATIRRWLRAAGAKDYNQRTQIILQTYEVPCPVDRKAFAMAAKRGEQLLDGSMPEGSHAWMKERLSEKGAK